MAILKNIYYPVITAAVVEDPTPGSTKMYMQFEAYDKLTLSPLFNQGLNHSTTGVDLTGFGSSYVRSDSWLSSHLGRLLLTGPVTEVQVSNTSNNNAYNNIDPMMWHSMDPTRPLRRVRYDTNGTTSILGLYACKVAGSGNKASYASSWSTGNDDAPWTTICFRLNTSSLDSSPVVNTRRGMDGAASQGNRAGANFYPVYFNTATGNMVLLQWSGARTRPDAEDGNVANAVGPSTGYGSRFTNYLTTSYSWSSNTSSYFQSRTGQFIGVDTGGRALFLINDFTTDYTQVIVRYLDVDNTSTVLFTNSTAPSAAGTNAGGNRDTGFGNYFPKYSSQTFSDPTSAGNRCWYTPFFDTAGKFHPFFFQWNVTSDTFTRNSDITVNWAAAGNQDNIWAPDTFSGSARDTAYGMQRLVFVDTFVSSGNRYLMFGQFHGSGTTYDNLPKCRTFVVFQVDAANPKLLTYHSSVTIPTTPRNIIYFNDSTRTQMGVFSASSFYTYNFTPGAGWTLSGTVPFTFAACGTDSLGRIWALAPGPHGYGEIHMITLNVPVTITVTSPQTTYNFTGTNINSSLTVNAYDTAGARIAVAVKLVIDGGSMTFAGSTLTTTINTSALADTTVPVTITGSGISNIIASVVL
jgi:hypothetical protein